ncbi:MAG: hypothetical protein ACRDPO_37840 [Streptosporangiaceae bacterium]
MYSPVADVHDTPLKDVAATAPAGAASAADVDATAGKASVDVRAKSPGQAIDRSKFPPRVNRFCDLDARAAIADDKHETP